MLAEAEALVTRDVPPPRAAPSAHRSRRRDPAGLPGAEAEARPSGKRHKRSRGVGEHRSSAKAKARSPSQGDIKEYTY